MNPSVEIAGLGFAAIAMADLIAAVEKRMAAEKLFLCLAPVDSVVLAQQDGELRRALNSADYLLADGMPVVWASRLLGTPLPQRIAGPDLFAELLELCRRRGYSAFFLGSDETTMARACQRAERDQIKVCGHYCPPRRQQFDALEIERMTAAVNQARPDFLFVVLGAPKQEAWTRTHLDRLEARVVVPIGAAFNVYAGRLVRAPHWMQRAGLEWLGRLVQEPRLWRRYGRDTIFAWWLLRELLRRRDRTGGAPR